MRSMEDNLQALADGFETETWRGRFRISCRECPKRWTVSRDGILKAGNMLHLLDHAASHGRKEGEDD